MRPLLAALVLVTACPPQAPAVVDAGVPRAAVAPVRKETPYQRRVNPRTLEAAWTPDGEGLLVVDWDACTVDAIVPTEAGTQRLGNICTERDAGTRGQHSIGQRFVFWRGERDPVTVFEVASWPWPKNQAELLLRQPNP